MTKPVQEGESYPIKITGQITHTASGGGTQVTSCEIEGMMQIHPDAPTAGNEPPKGPPPVAKPT